ncbi:glycosylhydrolase, partial [gut metagenome]
MGEKIENSAFFPAPQESFVGDPMPFYDEGKFHVFFLDDLRDGQQGYHPWSLYTTENLYDYEYLKEVIPFGTSSEEQDLALGTGSVIKDKEGVYHAFYTGHNDVPRVNRPKEAVMHATSTDLKKWDKRP